VVEGGSVVGTATADGQGNFSKHLLAQTPGIHALGIYSTDRDGLATSTVGYSVSLTAQTETALLSITLPPTISLSTTELRTGGALKISGLTVPSSTVALFISPTAITKSVVSSSDGYWEYLLNTAELGVGGYQVYAKTTTSVGYQSETSELLDFAIISAAPTLPLLPTTVAFFDADGSGTIELAEIFETVKAWVNQWRIGAAGEERCDLNGDGVCNLVDFSILLYYIGR